MEEREKHVQAYAAKNFLVVYGHQSQVEDAYRAGWDDAIKHLHSLPVREVLKIITEHEKH